MKYRVTTRHPTLKEGQIVEVREGLQGNYSSGWYEPIIERWKPEYNQEFFYVSKYGTAECEIWVNSFVDDDMWKIGNVFQWKSEAENIAQKIKNLLLTPCVGSENQGPSTRAWAAKC